MVDRRQLGELLVEAEIISVKTLERALVRQEGTRRRLGEVLEEMGVLTEAELNEALARQFGFKTVTAILRHEFPAELLALVPAELAVQREVFPLRRKEGMLAVAIANPEEEDLLDTLTSVTGLRIIPVLAPRHEIRTAIRANYLGEAVPDAERQRVLVIDPATAVTTVILVALEKQGYRVSVGRDGVEGLKLALAEHPDLIICAAVLPRLDTFTLQRTLAEHPETAGIPLILLTAAPSPEDEARALASGFIDVIPLPIQPQRVVARIQHALALVQRFQR